MFQIYAKRFGTVAMVEQTSDYNFAKARMEHLQWVHNLTVTQDKIESLRNGTVAEPDTMQLWIVKK